jgi:hypothetical protein
MTLPYHPRLPWTRAARAAYRRKLATYTPEQQAEVARTLTRAAEGRAKELEHFTVYGYVFEWAVLHLTEKGLLP